MPTEERQAATKLANALREAGLLEMAGRADTLYYSDFSSPLPFPKITLVDHLRLHDQDGLVTRVVLGEFDG